MGKQKSPPPPPPPPPPRAPPPVPPSSPSPLVNDAQHTLRATQTVFGSGADVGGVAPSWSDASWLSEVDFDSRSETDGARTVWAQVAPWGAFSLRSRFALDASTWNALRFTSRTSQSSFQVRWDLVDAEEGVSGTENTDYASDYASVPVTPNTTADTDESTSSSPSARRLASSHRRSLRQSPNSTDYIDSTPDAPKATVETWGFPVEASVLWRETFVPLDANGFFDTAIGNESATNGSSGTSTSTSGSTTSSDTTTSRTTDQPPIEPVYWDRLSWRDTSGLGGEIQLRDIWVESWVLAEAFGGENFVNQQTGSFAPLSMTAPPMPDAPPSVPEDGGDGDETGVNATTSQLSSETLVSPPSPTRQIAITADDGGSLTRFLVTAFFVAVVCVALCVVLFAWCLRRKRRPDVKKEEEDEASHTGVANASSTRSRHDHALVAAPARIPATDSRFASRAPRQHSKPQRRRPPLPRGVSGTGNDPRGERNSRDGSSGDANRDTPPDEMNHLSASDQHLSSECNSLGVSRNPSVAGDSTRGGDFGGVLRGDDQAGVVRLTADALALALETTVEGNTGGESTFSVESTDSVRTDSFASSRLSSDDFDTRRDTPNSHATVVELSQESFECDFTYHRALGRGASAVVHEATWCGGVGKLFGAGGDVKLTGAGGGGKHSGKQSDNKRGDLRVAVKLFRVACSTRSIGAGSKSGDATRSDVANFRQEVSILKALGNGNDKIVSLLATTQLNATKLAIVLVFVDGGTLHDAIHDSKEEDASACFRKRIRALHHVARALEYLHAGGCVDGVVDSGVIDSAKNRFRPVITHLDVKPKNVLIDLRSGNAVLADFGSARSFFETGGPVDGGTGGTGVDLEANLPNPNTTIGTVHYCAPELFEGGADFSVDGSSEQTVASFYKKCDVFSWSVTAYETVSGKIPWWGSTPTQIVERCGIELARPGWSPVGGGGDTSGLNTHTETHREVVTLLKRLVENGWAPDARKRPAVTEIAAALREMRRDLNANLNATSSMRKQSDLGGGLESLTSSWSETTHETRKPTPIRASSMELSSASE